VGDGLGRDKKLEVVVVKQGLQLYVGKRAAVATIL
jgi:hypothetical protein